MLKNFLQNFKNSFNNINNKNSALVCDFVYNGLIFDQNGIVKVCAKDDSNIDQKFILSNDFNGLWLDETDILNKKNELSSLFLQNQVPENCKNCCYLVPKTNKKNHTTFDFIYLNHWSCCFLNCKYCNRYKANEIEETNHYDIYPIINQLLDSKLIDKNTKIIFGCGDSTLHPDFDKLMYFFINSEFKNIIVHTSAQRFCQSIVDAMSKGIAKMIISFDSGCPYIYEQVKGVNKFDLTIQNIKRYRELQEKSQKNIVLNYTLVERVNDNQKEILDWFMLSRGLGIRSLSMDIDEKWYNCLNGNIPAFLKELILFSKQIAEYNNIEFIFSKKMQALYDKIK